MGPPSSVGVGQLYEELHDINWLGMRTCGRGCGRIAPEAPTGAAPWSPEKARDARATTAIAVDFLLPPPSLIEYVWVTCSGPLRPNGPTEFPKGVFMTKADIVQAVYTKLGGFSKKESADLVDLVFETMKETLGRGEKIKISGFGNFVLRDKRQRQGRNPQTGDPIVITARRVLNFKASQLLKQALNDGRLPTETPVPQTVHAAGEE